MLCSVKTEAVNADVLQALKIAVNDVLHIAVLGLEVSHADLTVGDPAAVSPLVVGNAAPGVPVLSRLEIVLNVGMVAGKVVGNDVADDLDAVLICCCAQFLQLGL